MSKETGHSRSEEESQRVAGECAVKIESFINDARRDGTLPSDLTMGEVVGGLVFCAATFAEVAVREVPLKVSAILDLLWEDYGKSMTSEEFHDQVFVEFSQDERVLINPNIYLHPDHVDYYTLYHSGEYRQCLEYLKAHRHLLAIEHTP